MLQQLSRIGVPLIPKTGQVVIVALLKRSLCHSKALLAVRPVGGKDCSLVNNRNRQTFPVQRTLIHIATVPAVSRRPVVCLGGAGTTEDVVVVRFDNRWAYSCS